MIPRLLLFIFISLSTISKLSAKNWQVGFGKTYTKPSQVANLVSNGDTVSIDPGLYSGDVCTWKASKLWLRGLGAPGVYAHLEANGQNAGGKAIWVIQGDSVTVQNIEFSGCQVPDHNGAGIRAEGLHLHVLFCSFHHNEMGILTTNDDNAAFVFEHNAFSYNGYGDGFSHNVYVGSVFSLVFQYNYSHHGKVGHLLKSRAQYNYILYNRLTDETGSDASREIDLPNGGTAIILGNVIEQSPESQNGNIIGFGMEGLANFPPHDLYLAYNTIVNDRFASRTVQFPAGLHTFSAKNNLIAGPAVFIDAGGAPAILDTIRNVFIPLVLAAGFKDAANYDYRLLAGASAIDLAIPPGLVNGFDLQAIKMYDHPFNWIARTPSGNASDVGAFEWNSPLANQNPGMRPITVFPNPVCDFLKVSGSELPESIRIFNSSGELCAFNRQNHEINLHDLPAGWYYYEVLFRTGEHAGGILVKVP